MPVSPPSQNCLRKSLKICIFQPTIADYDAVPIEAFGLAMLRGMGWKDGEGIGKNKK